jgi:hypothetical protein
MRTLIVTAKGQVTLRKDLLNHLGIHAGQKVAVEKLPGGRIEMRAMQRTGKVSELFGMLKPRNRRLLSVEDISKIASQGWAGKR